MENSQALEDEEEDTKQDYFYDRPSLESVIRSYSKFYQVFQLGKLHCF